MSESKIDVEKISGMVGEVLGLVSKFKNYTIDKPNDEFMPNILTLERIEEGLVDVILELGGINRD